MANFNLASLPPSMLHKILSKVATTSIRDFGCARVALPDAVGREDYFYKSVDLIFLNDWLDHVKAVRTFRLKCYQLGNPEAIYLRAMYEYFILHLLDEGRKTIRLAGERGCLLAKYVDGMMNLAFSVDHKGLVHNYPDFTREYVDRMYHMFTSWALSGHWGYGKPEMFMSLLERIDPNVCYDCWCSTIIEPVFVVSIDGSRTRWKCDRCFRQCAAWDFRNKIHLTARDWPFGD
ncbi:unnamed protein product [Brassica rapa]|uniref:At2g35280-like TPR domain-containing protein n=1 Tax=Brassica campestris TaxID=3711 RepID=A0A3P5Y1W4_BRACM|nr:unnamed protein product [Brassica rapa]VDC61402.1 unnamed protein product [Brassica rapa]